MTTDEQTLTDETLRAAGISTRHGRMVNGELRFRLLADDGSAYIRTVASESGGWQNSHYHEATGETYIVQQGWMALAEEAGQDVAWHILMPGDVYTTKPNVPHNVYLPGHAVIHTVKHGPPTEGDWYACPDLDAKTKPVSEDAILRTTPRSDAKQ